MRNSSPKSAFKVAFPVPDPGMPPSSHDELVKLLNDQMLMLTDVKAQVTTTNIVLARIDTENKAMITQNTAAIRGLDDAFKSKASRVDDRFKAIEERVSQLVRHFPQALSQCI